MNCRCRVLRLRTKLTGVVLTVVLMNWLAVTGASDEAAQPYGLQIRTEWKSSRVVGSPEPPLPYMAVKTFSAIKWERPIYAKREPGSSKLFVIQQGAEREKLTRILTVEDRADATETKLLIEVPERVVYGLEFHPAYEKNGFVYLFGNGPTGQSERKNRISRFTVKHDSESVITCSADSELVIIEWRSMGHDGGDLVFGHDGMLYVTSGDGTSDSDAWLSAQDVTNLLGGVLRIDVEHPTADRQYSIPPDNPFLHIPNARGELWAIGLRNPWRMTVDAKTGQIWVGSNGQDLWEYVNLLGRGENYGWSVYEGSHPFYVHRELGPGKLTVPTFEHHHTESRSLTGGVVYYGDRLPELNGAYVYGDYSTGKIWAGRHDGTKVTWHREIADTALQIAGFSNSHQGELLVVDHTGGIYKMEVNPASLRPSENPKFPTKLSETGIFESVSEHRVAPGVMSYSVISPAWNDGATAQRFMAIPGTEKIEYADNRGWKFPDGSVLVQTLSMDIIADEGASKRRIETRLLVRQQGEWAGYSYRWNSQQDDAILVPTEGDNSLLNVASDGKTSEKQPWRFPGRAECMSCHSRAVNYTLGTTTVQMNRTHDYGGISDNQLRTLEHIGLFTAPLSKPADERKKLVDPHDGTLPLESRAKAYLHTNCSSCHVSAGGGNARMELEFVTALDRMEIVSQFPQHDTFGITQPMIIAPGQPDRSVMLARLTRRGRGQMPPLVSNRADVKGVELIKQWVASMQSDRKFVKEWTIADIKDHLPKTAAGRSFERGAELIKKAGCGQCHRIQDEIAGIGPNLSGLASRMKVEEILTNIVTPSATITEKYAQTIIATTDGQVLQGRVESESDDSLVLRGSESFAVPITVKKADIEQRSLSKVSAMPVGTINHLELDEILDLIAYLVADGNREHAAFKK